MALKVDDFEPISNGDLKELWKMNRDPTLRRLILEVVRYRRVLDSAHAEAIEIDHGLRNKDSGRIVGSAGSLLKRLGDEKVRLGSVGGRVIKLDTDDQYRKR